ncbi:hypothetical protein XaC1_62 [Xanthomonas phage XaC1]|nr:hypothetical protein XaC1_62 [Xanthomonas phage XaC1]
MNKFKAVSEVLKNGRKSVDGTEWNYMFQGTRFACISKQDGKYFVHYEGRTTALQSYPNFMKAIAFVADLYCRLYNSAVCAGGTEVTFYRDITVYVGTDGKPYTKLAGKFSLVQVFGNCYQHLSKYYSDVMSDIEIGYFADVMEQAISDYLNRDDE